MDHFAQYVSAQRGRLWQSETPVEIEVYDRLDEDHDNVRHALAHGLLLDRALGLRMVNDLFWFWLNRGHWVESRDWRGRYLTPRDGLDAVLVGHVLLDEALTWWDMEEHAEAAEATQEAYDLLSDVGSRVDRARAVETRGFLHVGTGDYSKSVADYTEAMDVYLEEDLPVEHHLVVTRRALHAGFNEDTQIGRSWQAKALEATRRVGSLSMESIVMMILGAIEMRDRNYEAAERAFEAAFPLQRQMHNLRHQQHNHWWRGRLYEEMGDRVSAYAHYRACGAVIKRLVNPAWASWAVYLAGVQAGLMGRPADARERFEEAGSICGDLDEERRREGVLRTQLAIADIDLLQERATEARERLSDVTACLSDVVEVELASFVETVARLAFLEAQYETAANLSRAVKVWRDALPEDNTPIRIEQQQLQDAIRSREIQRMDALTTNLSSAHVSEDVTPTSPIDIRWAAGVARDYAQTLPGRARPSTTQRL